MAEPRLLGVDRAPAPQAPAGQSGLNRAPDLQVAESIWQRTADLNVQAAATRERTQQAMGQKAIAENAREIQQKSSRSGGLSEALDGVFSSIVTGLGAYREARTARKEAEAKAAEEQREALGEAEYAQLLRGITDTIAQAEVDIQDISDREGALAVHRELMSKVEAAEYLDDEERAELYRYIQSNTDNLRENHLSRLASEQRRLQANALDDAVRQAQMELLPIVSSLQYDTNPATSQATLAQAIAFIDEQVQALPNASISDQYEFRAQLLESLIPQVSSNQSAIALLSQQIEQTDEFIGYVSELQMLDAQGLLQEGEFDKLVAQGRARFPQANQYNPMSIVDIMDERIAIVERMRTLEQLATPEAAAASSLQMGGMVAQYFNGVDPAIFGSLEDSVVAAAQQIEAANRRKEGFQDDITRAQTRLAEATRTIGRLTAAGRIIQAVESGQLSIEDLNRQQFAWYQDRDRIRTELSEANITRQEATSAITVAEQRLAEATQMLAQYGLQDGIYNYNAWQQHVNSAEGQETMTRAAQQVTERQEQQQRDFISGGGNVPRPSPLRRGVDSVSGSNQVDWSGVVVPFADGTAVSVSSGFGNRTHPVYGGTRFHQGVDFSAPHGTPITAVRHGRVSRVLPTSATGGYGNSVFIQHEDGTESIYAHMSSLPDLQVGQVVGQGQVIGTVGSTGTSTGNHLHFGVTDQPGSWNFTVNPHEWLSRTPAETHWQTGYTVPSPGMTGNPSARVGATPGAAPTQNSFVLPSGWYIEDGMLHSPYGISTPVGQGIGRPEQVTGWQQSDRQLNQVFNNANPVRGAMLSNSRSEYPDRNNPNHNHGYEHFRLNPHHARKLAEVADNVGIPAVWLADIMFFETGGSFNPGTTNSEGAVGLIQFHPSGGLAEVAQDMGVSIPEARRRLQNMSFVEQMDYVERYLLGYSRGDTQFRGRYDTVDRLLMTVFRGKPAAFSGNWTEHMGDADSNRMTVGRYTTQLGAAVGRRYYTIYDRQVGTPVHTSSRHGCPTCQAMNRAGQFAPHIQP